MLGCGVPKAHPCRTCWSLSWMSAAGYRTEDRPLALCGRPLRLGRAGTLPLRNHRLPPALAQRRGRCLAAPWRWRFPPPRRRKAATCTAWSEVSWRLATWTRSGPAGARSVGPLRGAGFAAVAGVPAAPQQAGGHNEAPRGVAGAGDPLDQEVRARRAHILDIVGDDPEPELVTSGLHCLASRGPAERTSTIGVSAGPRSCSQVRCPRR